MGRKFEIPSVYRSPVIGAIKQARRSQDPRKKDFAPFVIDLGPVRFKVARHFGFCFGVENAIEIAYRALDENPGKRVFLLSEMIHNPQVNGDLQERGVRFLQKTDGTQLIPFAELRSDDVVIVPAFGTTRELFQKLAELGIDPQQYNATCPFVEKVWKRSEELGRGGFTVIIHGKEVHEETRATFSHARSGAPSLVIRDMNEAENLARYIRQGKPFDSFLADFEGRYSEGFSPERDLERIGVVNQTTMLASETLAIAELLKEAMRQRVGDEQLSRYFADTRDTLCYATWDNQEAVKGLIASGGDLAIVVGGYKSSNTSHLVELLEEHLPTFYIQDATEMLDVERISHLKWRTMEVVESPGWLPRGADPVTIMVTAGASCPDAVVDEVVMRVASFFGVAERLSAELLLT